jgi:outer membrane protein, heavy metal efflux system
VPITLDAAIDAAAAANIDVVTARNARQSAAAGVRSADTFPNPVLSLGSTSIRPGHFIGDAFNGPADDVVRIDQPFERGGKRQARVGSARAALAAAGSDIADTLRQVRATVAGAWIDLMVAEARAALYDGIAASYRQSQTLAERRLAAGAISAGDLARQRVEMLRAQSDLSRAISDRREAQLALAVLIGAEPDAAALQTAGGWHRPPAAGNDNIDAIVAARPDVRAADARVSATSYAYAGARALRHPDISIGAQYEHGGNNSGSSVGIGFAVPLQIGNRYSGEIDAASVDRNQAQATAAKVRAVATAEITTARRAAEDASARRARYDDDLLPSARKAAATAEFAYARGALALVDLLDARRTLQSIELAAIDAHADEAKALARQAAAETPEEAS